MCSLVSMPLALEPTVGANLSSPPNYRPQLMAIPGHEPGAEEKKRGTGRAERPTRRDSNRLDKRE